MACVLFAAIALTAAVDLTLYAQSAVCIPILLLILLARSAFLRTQRVELQSLLRLFASLLGTYVTLRYLFWRSFETLNYDDLGSFIGTLALYGAELYGIALYFLGLFVNANPLRRELPALPTEQQDSLPTVDVLITSYDEDPDLIETTLLATRSIAYPQHKLQIYLLDDGGTLASRFSSDPVKRASAQQRHNTLIQICYAARATYLTRIVNEHAKSGNLNSALRQSTGEFVLVLDADHIPTVDILEKTVPLMLRDKKLFLVQTPHYFVTPDPVERNLQTFHQMPSENEMFYSVIQPGLDFWDSSIFCGSAALLRRSHLERIDGFASDTVTEDAETSLKLHNLGLRSAYVSTPVTAGLQPGTFVDFVRQRVRWAQGMTQIFMLHNPLFMSGLQPWQRLSYLNALLFWFFGFARLVFILAPSAYLIFGWKIYDANLPQVLAFTLPHIIASWIITDLLFGRHRWPFISELYEYMLSIFTTFAVFKTIINPRSPHFTVTPKNVHTDTDSISKFVAPFYVLLMIVIVSFALGIWRYGMYPDQSDSIIISLVWESFNLVILLGALGALLERRQRRHSPRLNLDLAVELVATSARTAGILTDMSIRGGRLCVTQNDASLFTLGSPIELVIYGQQPRSPLRLSAKVSGLPKTRHSHMEFTIKFDAANTAAKTDIIALLYGSSTRWAAELTQRDRPVGVLPGLAFLVFKGTVHTVYHLGWLIRHGLRYFFRADKPSQPTPRPLPAKD